MTDDSSGFDAPGALSETARFLDAIIENLPHMIFVKDAAELRFVRFNRAGEELLGIPRAEMYGKNDHDFFPAEEADFFTAKDRAVLESGRMLDIPEEPIHTTKKGVRWLHTKKIPILDSEGRPIYLLGISEDITVRRQQAAERDRLLEDLARSNEDLEQFAFAASHDLQAPLRKVQAFGDRLLERYGEQLGEIGQDYVERMGRSAALMEVLIRDLLEFSRVATRSDPYRSVDLTAMTQQLVDEIFTPDMEEGATVTIGEMPSIRGEPAQLRRLLQNLIGNAIKFHKPGVPANVHVTAVVIDDPGQPGDNSRSIDAWCELRVEDDGIGFDPQYGDRIFGVFERLHGRDAYSGTGIGLALCRKIAQRHRGEIRCESSPDEGAAFIVKLPMFKLDR